MTKSRRLLRGDHNQCPTCLEYFNSGAAFEKHRIGAFNARRCMTVDEMLDAGMALNADKWWVTMAWEGPFQPSVGLQDALLEKVDG